MPGNKKLPKIASFSRAAETGCPRAGWYPREVSLSLRRREGGSGGRDL